MNANKTKLLIEKKKYPDIFVYAADDWRRITINGETYYEGHDIPETVWLELMEIMVGAVTSFEYMDDDWWDKNV